MTDEKLIEAADEYTRRNIGGMQPVTTIGDKVHAAFLAGAVFEKAHAKELDTSTEPVKNGGDSLHVAPTDDAAEREEISRIIDGHIDAPVSSRLAIARSLQGNGFRRSGAPEPSVLPTFFAPKPGSTTNRLVSEPQGEPSDAQVRAAWDAYITAQESDPYDREGRMRAALRAAGEVK